MQLSKKQEFKVGDGNVMYSIPRDRNYKPAGYELDARHPGAKKMYIKPRSRFCTRVLRGQTPPSLDHWDTGGGKRANFIEFYAFH